MNSNSRALGALLTCVLLAPISGAVQSPKSGPLGGSEKPSALTNVRNIFKGLDRDSNGAVSRAELRASKIRITDATFSKRDVDGDKELEADEFVVLYKDLLTVVRRPIPAELRAEIARIQTRRRVQEAAKKKAQKKARKRASRRRAGAK